MSPIRAVTLVVLDGTWHHARSLFRENPWLDALPKYAFSPPAMITVTSDGSMP